MRYFLRKQERSLGVSDRELIKIAVKSMGLDELGPFNPEDKIIEYQLLKGVQKGLVDLSVRDFMEETASESPAPGGGSVSAYIGSLGVALGTMVANLSAHKRGWDERWEEFSRWAEQGKAIQEQLLHLVDEDTRAFNAILEAFRMPKKSREEQQAREMAVEKATIQAIEVPFRVMKVAVEGYQVIEAMVDHGSPSSISDAGVGALALHASIEGAWMNVRINASGMKTHPRVKEILNEGAAITTVSHKKLENILEKEFSADSGSYTVFRLKVRITKPICTSSVS